MDTDKIENYLNQVDAITIKPEKFLSFQDKEAEEIKLLTRNLYNFSKKKENIKKKRQDALEALVIAGLDEEQIWQQVELQNNVIFDSLVKDVAHLLAKKDELQFPLKKKKKSSGLKKEKNNERKLSKKELKKKVNKYDINEDKISAEEKNYDSDHNQSRKNKIKFKKPSIVDDKFFKLHEMEEFLEKFEKEQDKFDNNDDEDIDLFEPESTIANEDSEYQIHYKDFFDQPYEVEYGKDNKSREELDQEMEKKLKKVKFSEENEETEEESEEENFDDENEEDNNDIQEESEEEFEKDYNMKGEEEEEEKEEEEEEEESNEDESYMPKQISTFENRQKMLKSRIKALEEEALKEKPWQMKGEVTGQSRPQNSLLQEYVEFDIASRPPPVLTEKTTLKLEDIIIQRIKDKAWDDVQRKIKPIEDQMEYKKKLVLDQEKSKLSLAQIYEQEYLKQLDSKSEDLKDRPEVEPPEHQEIKIMINKLFSKLDALSNFHFTPKQVEPEIKIVSNLPAINMEEVAPVAASDAALLAPEEVKPKSKGDLLGKSERSSTDKKRERRKKKLLQKLKHKKLEAKAKLQLEKGDSKGLKNNNLSQKLLERITKSTNVTKLKETEGKNFKSQNAIFSKLQDERNSKVKNKKFEIKSPKPGKKLKMKKSSGK